MTHALHRVSIDLYNLVACLECILVVAIDIEKPLKKKLTRLQCAIIGCLA